MTYPILLNLEDKPCLIIGGGNVAKRKAEGLIAAGAHVTVVSPVLHSEFPAVAHIADSYQPRYLDEVSPVLVFAATDDAAINQAVWADSQARNILVNLADAPADFTNMIAWQNLPLTVAISTGGASPLLGQHMRRLVADLFSEGYGEFARHLLDLRAEIIDSVPYQPDRHAFWQSILTPELFALLDARQHEAAIAALREAAL